MNFEIESCVAGDINNLVLSPKKLKTRPNDFASISKSRVVPVTVAKEEPVVEEPVTEPEKPKTYSFDNYDKKSEPEDTKKVDINIDEIINARINGKEEKEEPKHEESEPMDDNIEFAYAGRVVKPEVSDEAITRIKSLGDDYKGEVHPTVSSVNIEPEEPKYDESKYVSLLKTECYSPKTKKYLDKRLEEYQSLLTRIEEAKKKIEEITDKYKMESEIAVKLNSIKKETYGIMTWINSSDFKILKNEKTSAVNNLFKSYEDLFNENQQKFKKADEELAKTNDISAELGKEEKEAREELSKLGKEKKATVKEYYEKVEEVIALDNSMKKQASEMTAITGIDDSSTDDGYKENKFDSLRSDE